MKKGQTALEYLMTYGWAILIVIIVVSALYALGLAKPCRWVGTQITGFSGGGFQVETPKFNSAGTLVFDLKRIGSATVNATTISATKGTTTQSTSYNQNMQTGNSTVITISNLGAATAGDCYALDATVNYIESTRTFTASGKISGTVES